MMTKPHGNISDLVVTDNNFFVEIDNQHKAFITYSKKGDKYVLDHCQVPPELRGQGVGQVLVKKTFDHINVKAEDTIIHCSYIKSIAKKLDL